MSASEEEETYEIEELLMRLRLQQEEEEEENEEQEQHDGFEENEEHERDEEDEEEEEDDEEQDSQEMPRPDWYDYEDYLAEGETYVDWEKWDQYYKEIEETQGYGLTVDVGLCEMAALRPVPNFKRRYNFFCRLCDLAIKKFNENNSGKEFEVVDVEWVVNGSSRGVLYLLTFNAKDTMEGVKTFEAKVLDGIMNEEPEVFACRMKAQQN